MYFLAMLKSKRKKGKREKTGRISGDFTPHRQKKGVNGVSASRKKDEQRESAERRGEKESGPRISTPGKKKKKDGKRESPTACDSVRCQEENYPKKNTKKKKKEGKS